MSHHEYLDQDYESQFSQITFLVGKCFSTSSFRWCSASGLGLARAAIPALKVMRVQQTLSLAVPAVSSLTLILQSTFVHAHVSSKFVHTDLHL